MPLQIIRQDITQMRVDAIVNTTNQEMIGYSGVDLAIHMIAGAEFDAQCAKLAPLENIVNLYFVYRALSRRAPAWIRNLYEHFDHQRRY